MTFYFFPKSPKIHRTPLYRARAAYANMYRRCENRCGTEPAYAKVKLRMTKSEWLDWALPKYRKFARLHPDESPSVSRKGDKGHYEIGNIQIISWQENRKLMATPARLKEDGTKRCATCKKVQNARNYYKNKATFDGLAHQCKACRKEVTAEYNSRPEVKEHRRLTRKRR